MTPNPNPAANFTTLDQWLAWQAGLNPRRMELGLDRMAAVWSALGAPDLGCPVVTVGGTNGKGSCVAMIEAMAQAAGYRTGAYTSPHLLRYNERVRICGEPIADAGLIDAFARVDRARGEIPLTYFEFGTLAALLLFADAPLDLAVLEVGLGGRLDAVNLIDADVSVVVSIGRDHMDWLGETPDEIAREKAGIFRPGRPAVIGQPDAPPALRAQAERIGARPLQVGREIDAASDLEAGGWIWGGPGGRLALPTPSLRGAFQIRNAAAAVTALKCLGDRLPIPAAALRAGLVRARLPGRFQVQVGSPTRIYDVAHNREAAEALAQNLKGFRREGSLLAVLAVLGDKEPESLVAPLLGLVDRWWLAASADARAMPVERLAERLAGLVPEERRVLCPTVPAAVEAAVGESGAEDCLLIFGSFVTVAEALQEAGG